jgi:predicted Ser/Thr protein kinase
VKGSPPVPVNEPQRLAALLSCHILDTEPEPAFDGVALLASQLCGAPTALVSLVDESRQWFKARVGLQVSETPRSISFCAHAILGHAPFVIEDAREDPRFADNPLVTGEPYVRFYAGVPLVLDDGSAIGSLCVLDKEPRHLSEAQLASLKVLARQVSTEIGLRRKLASTLPPPRPSSIPATVDGPTLDMTSPRELRAAAEQRLPIAAGELVEGRYRIEAVLGEGGMGVVARAVDVERGATVALKFMLAHALAHRDSVQRFVREAQILLKIDNPHVARVFDVGNLPGGEPFIVMEYLEGEDLKVRLERRGQLPTELVIEVGIQLCEALAAAHALGILHRDLKPANLFLTRTEHGPEVLKVLDFGISKLLGADDDSLSPLTSDSTIVGSPHYMSPEQMVTPSSVDARSDLWAVGVVLYELLLGRSPFDGNTLTEVCAQVLTHEPSALHGLRPDVSPALSGVVWRCLRKHPEARHASARDLGRELAKLRAPQ